MAEFISQFWCEICTQKRRRNASSPKYEINQNAGEEEDRGHG